MPTMSDERYTALLEDYNNLSPEDMARIDDIHLRMWGDSPQPPAKKLEEYPNFYELWRTPDEGSDYSVGFMSTHGTVTDGKRLSPKEMTSGGVNPGNTVLFLMPSGMDPIVRVSKPPSPFSSYSALIVTPSRVRGILTQSLEKIRREVESARLQLGAAEERAADLEAVLG